MSMLSTVGRNGHISNVHDVVPSFGLFPASMGGVLRLKFLLEHTHQERKLIPFE